MIVNQVCFLSLDQNIASPFALPFFLPEKPLSPLECNFVKHKITLSPNIFRHVDSHLGCKTVIKYLNVREQVEVVERNEDVLFSPHVVL